MIWSHPACYALFSGGSSCTVTKTEDEKIVMVYNAFARCATLLIDPMLGCGMAFMLALNDRPLSEILFSLPYRAQGPASVHLRVREQKQKIGGFTCSVARTLGVYFH